MNVRAALASIVVVAWVLIVGSLADFGDTYSRTAFALGIVAAVPGFMLADWIITGEPP